MAHRLLFIGLWTLADRLGRLKDRPKRIKAELFPWDDCDVDPMLEDLHAIGLIQRYEVDGAKLVCISSFLKHQRPHPREAESTLPEPRGAPRLALGSPRTALGKPRFPEKTSLPGEGKEILDNGVGKEISVSGAPRQRTPPVHPQQPEKSGSGFFAWVQAARIEHGFASEALPNPSMLSTWYSEAMMELNGDDGRLRATYERFADDPYWKAATPPWPFRAFVTRGKWRDYVPPLAAIG